MLLAYLQRTSPPVLPFLQQLETPKKPKRKVIVDGHDTYYFHFDNVDELKAVDTHVAQSACRPALLSAPRPPDLWPGSRHRPQVWPEHGQNTMSLGELAIGFLRYYCEEFDFAENVVNLRTPEIVTKADKDWANKAMAVEGAMAQICSCSAKPAPRFKWLTTATALVHRSL